MQRSFSPVARTATFISSFLALGFSLASAATWTGTITMYAQNYTPNSTLPGATKLQGLRQVADTYEKLHPGVKIKFVDEQFSDYTQTVRTKSAAAELWDVFWAQYGDLNGVYPKGIATDLRPYFQQKNPYAPAAATWVKAINATVLAEVAAPDGAIYNINGDYVATTFYYNPALFKKAGIAKAPTSWNELVADAKKLKAAGITPATGIPVYSWYQRLFLSDFYSRQFAMLAGYDKLPGISQLDKVVAIKKGLLSTKDPRFMGWWPLVKTFTDTWSPDYFTLKPFSPSDNSTQDFSGGKVGMIYFGSWIAPGLRQNQVNFSTFSFPVIGKTTTPYSTGIDTSNQVGGPGGGYQFAMSTARSNATLKQPGKLEAVLDWMRYLGSPKVNEQVVNDYGAFIPTLVGTMPAKGAEALSAQAKIPLRAVTIDTVGPQLDDAMQRLFAQYLSGNLSLTDATTQVQQELDLAVAAYEKTNGAVDISAYK